MIPNQEFKPVITTPSHCTWF